MSGGSTSAIGLVFRRPTELLDLDPFFHSFLSGVEEVLARDEYGAMLRFVDSDKGESQAYERLFLERRVDGFILTDLRANDPRYVQLAELGAPTVLAGTPSEKTPFPRVGTGTRKTLRELITHLISQGHVTIAHITGLDRLQHSEARLNIWRDTLFAAGLTPGPVEHGDFSSEGGARATQRLLSRPGERPTAIVFANDVMALAGISVLNEAGVKVPTEIAVAGFDDIPLASFTTPPLTTIHCDYVEMGRRAAELLLGVLRGEDVPQDDEIGGTLRLRASTEGWVAR